MDSKETRNIDDGKAESDFEYSPNESKQEESTSSSHDNSFCDLQDFRDKWKKELSVLEVHQETNTDPSDVKNDDEKISNYENIAKSIFLKGVDMEKKGKLYEAIQFYRKAIQMVPDIEKKIQDSSKLTNDNNSSFENEENSEIIEMRDGSDEYDNSVIESEFIPKIKNKLSKQKSLCKEKFHQETTHISVLPIEIILHILKWVVSADLDLVSLEMFGQVCRGFYLCARDSEIWKLACVKVWGIQCGKSPGGYRTWRQMFINRSRLRFNGCYISKTTYIRHGENNFQDQFYRPWHLVAYFRYLRFFPDGVVLLLTSSDEPSQCVTQLRHRNTRSPVLSGYYRLKEDRVSLIIYRPDNSVNQNFKRNRNRESIDNSKQSYHMELQILDHKNKKHVQLQWIHYSIERTTRTGDVNECVFDLVNNKFPSFWFSRVRSYTKESEISL